MPSNRRQLEEAYVLAAYCESVFVLDSLSLPEEYGYRSLPLCVIDCIYSINASYASTRNVVKRYCEHYHLEPYWCGRYGLPPKESQESVQSFADKIMDIGVERFMTDVFQNEQMTSTRSGIRKAEAVLQVAELLIRHRVNYLQDVLKVVSDPDFEREFRSIPGQRSGVSFNYFLMLAGSDDLAKPDRMIIRFIEQAVGRKVSPDEAVTLIQSACNLINVKHPSLNPKTLDHVIWEYQRSREGPRQHRNRWT
jgi:hypothetical protein